MGIHGSATCVMHFEEAKGYLVGAPHKGLRCMFTMMNGARLGVGLQGLGLGETAYQSATAYAKDRRQGRGLKGAEEPEASADPIIVHPDVRRMLLTQRAINEGSRALAYWTALQLDISRSHADATVREDADELVQLMTPIIKAFFTDYGFEATNLAVQVHGGHGYIREHGMEQLVRDARISQIYEGANGIQALDLVGRKLPQRAGRYLRHFFHPAVAFVEENKDDPELTDIVGTRRQGAQQAADRDAGHRPARPGRSRGSRRGGLGLSQDVRSGGGRLHVVPDGEARPRQAERRRLLRHQAQDRPLLRAEDICRTPPGSSSRSWPARAPSWPTAQTSSERRVPRGA